MSSRRAYNRDREGLAEPVAPGRYDSEGIVVGNALRGVPDVPVQTERHGGRSLQEYAGGGRSVPDTSWEKWLKKKA